MTNRERMLLGLSGGQPDRIAWAPNFDWWLGVNKNKGTLPEELKGSSRNDIVRKIGGAIWARRGHWLQRQRGARTKRSRFQ